MPTRLCAICAAPLAQTQADARCAECRSITPLEADRLEYRRRLGGQRRLPELGERQLEMFPKGRR